MNINKHNYEAFFLDYHEGNLSPQQVAELLLFVEQHPELKEEFESFENISLTEFSNISFENKAELKKEITADNKDYYFIGATENTLNAAEHELLNAFLKQHPHYFTELELFKKTKLTADTAVVFENKEQLKEIALNTDTLLIAAVEGLLTQQETSMLNHQLAVDAQMQHQLALYKQTKLVADTNIVFENKDALKRKGRRIIPLYYYVAAAAAVLLLFGLFNFFQTSNVEDQKFANQQNTKTGITPNNTTLAPENNTALANTTTAPSPAVSETSSSKKNTSGIAKKLKNKTVKDNGITNTPIENNSIANNTAPEQQPKEEKVEIAIVEAPRQHDQTPAVANIENKKENTQTEEDFLSLRQLAVSKFKEKALTNKSYAEAKKSGRDKKLNGWDVLSAVAKGVSKVTGKKVEVEHTSSEGEVTAMR